MHKLIIVLRLLCIVTICIGFGSIVRISHRGRVIGCSSPIATTGVKCIIGDGLGVGNEPPAPEVVVVLAMNQSKSCNRQKGDKNLKVSHFHRINSSSFFPTQKQIVVCQLFLQGMKLSVQGDKSFYIPRERVFWVHLRRVFLVTVLDVGTIFEVEISAC